MPRPISKIATYILLAAAVSMSLLIYTAEDSPLALATPEQSATPLPVPSHLEPAALEIPIPGVGVEDLRDSYLDPRGADRLHEAMDIMAPTGTPVVAVDDGTLIKLFDSKPGGLTIYQFDLANERAYYYAHLDGYAVGLEEGQFIRRGQLIGYVGATGNATPLAPHLHFAVFELGPEKQWWKGTPINPYPLFQSQGQLLQQSGKQGERDGPVQGVE